jgi:transcription-repair coupling factor (superfamily II helicase)
MKQNQAINHLGQLLNIIPGRSRPVECIGCGGPQIAYLISRIAAKCGAATVLIVPSAGDVERYLEDLRFFLYRSGRPIIPFPAYHVLPFKNLSYHNQTAAERIRTLYSLASGESAPVVVASVDALLQKLIPKKELVQYAELILQEEETSRDGLIEKLVSGGYQSAALVEEPGDFAVRGGILDIFTPLYPDPVRMEFFGDLVDSIHFFSAQTQRRLKPAREVVILPAKEVILQQDRMPEIVRRLRAQAVTCNVPVSRVRKLVERLDRRLEYPGIESVISLIYDDLESFFDYLPGDALLGVVDPEAAQAAARRFEQTVHQNYTHALNNRTLCVSPEKFTLSASRAREAVDARRPIRFRMIDVQSAGTPAAIHYESRVENSADLVARLRRGHPTLNLFGPLAEWTAQQHRAGIRIRMVCRTPSKADRLKALLEPHGVRLQDESLRPSPAAPAGGPSVQIGNLSAGFYWPDEKLAILTEEDIFGVRRHRALRSESKPAAQLLNLQELKQDDLVVHVDHGIGRFQGLKKLTLNGTTSDFLLILYKDDDKLYLPVDRMGMVQKYMGVEGITPTLDKMGGSSWERVKARVKRSAEKIAGELLKLYARRQVEKGHAFSPAEADLNDFEAGFVYEETADQLQAIQDVLEDMQRSTPMDRLVCGDVGYGKTEVALRAAYMAVQDGKQAAILVPTTILAEQHYNTFRERFEPYPVTIAGLSRFRPPKEQRSIIEGIRSGRIDIVIGTHRLLQKDVNFKDLGLLILDEEQRFGVRHKEKIKKMRSSIDVLALTATPIPRTLHLSLTGIRDISLIATPPEYRKSIMTYICEFDETIIADAVRKELQRGGQVFFVHNHVQSIERMGRNLQRLVPEARLGIAHGQMEEEALERAMLSFVDREIDLLVCTTIIESGLDITSANTIIVNRADRFGLSQMYQLRGRVGRAGEQAFAYLLIPHETLLTKDAQKRLKVLMEHSDLGSGFQIAMNDLRIRGGGTILGASQSGHIAAVGYDMFLKLMETAVSEMKGQAVLEPLDPEINLPLSAFLADSYIADINQRMLMYRRLARMNEPDEVSEIKAELEDRFGPLAEEGTNLLFKILLKILARKAGVSRLDLAGHQLALHFSPAYQKHPRGLVDLMMKGSLNCRLTPDHVLKVDLARGGGNGQLAQTKNILIEIARRVNN